MDERGREREREKESRSSQSLTLLDPAMPEADMKFLITQSHRFHLDLREHESSVYCLPFQELCFTHQDPACPLLGDRIPEGADSSLGAHRAHASCLGQHTVISQ